MMKKNNIQYNHNQTNMAGKITVVTAIAGFVTFMLFFVINLGSKELQKVEAQFDEGFATTTLTVLNVPPQWVPGQEGRELVESSSSSPTNSFSDITWVGTATDSNNAPYFLLICSTSASPTANAAADLSSLGTAPPNCDGGIQWGVSAATPSGDEATVSTTTTQSPPFGQTNDWYAWVCDDDPVNPRCSSTSSQGIAPENSSPFFVNPRPLFTGFSNNGPVDPGGTLTFLSTSSDVYSFVDLDIFLVVCSADTYDPLTNECGPGDFIASTTGSFKSNATAVFSLPPIVQDADYSAYGYIYDQFGHNATGSQGTNVTFTVNNVAPTVAGGTIILNDGDPLILTNPGGETTGFTLDFIAADANSCLTATSSFEIVDFVASVFRTGVGSTTCNGSAGSYNPNSCYPSGVDSAVWNLNCVASTTSCTGPTDDTMLFNCSFPLWFIADPTNGTAADTPFFDQAWTAAVAAIDNDGLTGPMTVAAGEVELLSLVAIDLQTTLIAYDQLEPGDSMPNLTATTSLRILGNTGLNQILYGDSMCGTYSPGNPCPVSATSTIPQDQQRYATSSVAFGSGLPLASTSSSTPFEIRIPKPTSTSTPSTGVTYWGIAVPSSIQLAGLYTGMNTFLGDVSAPSAW